MAVASLLGLDPAAERPPTRLPSPGLLELRRRINQTIADRALANWRQASFDAGLPYNTLHKLMRTPTQPSPKTLRVLAAWLRVPEDDLFSLIGHRSPGPYRPSDDPFVALQDVLHRWSWPTDARDAILSVARLNPPRRKSH